MLPMEFATGEDTPYLAHGVLLSLLRTPFGDFLSYNDSINLSRVEKFSDF